MEEAMVTLAAELKEGGLHLNLSFATFSFVGCTESGTQHS